MMKNNIRHFVIRWAKKVNFGQPCERETVIHLPKASKDTGVNAKAALNILTSQYGNLKKIDIIWMKELDENGKQIGDLITPDEETNIIPVKK